MKRLILFTIVMSMLISCKKNETEQASLNSGQENTSLKPTYKDVKGLTYTSGYINLEFNPDGKLRIYQQSPGSYATGCAAEGTWTQQKEIIKVSVTQSFCETRSYSDVSGTYTQNENCISNGSHDYCNGD